MRRSAPPPDPQKVPGVPAGPPSDAHALVRDVVRAKLVEHLVDASIGDRAMCYRVCLLQEARRSTVGRWSSYSVVLSSLSDSPE
jgi:hypothetical protein